VAGLASAETGLARPDLVRNSLAYLADETGARLAADAALSLPDVLLTRFVEDVRKDAPSIPSPIDSKALGWLLEKKACANLVASMDREEEAAAVSGLLLLHAGAVARYPAEVQELAEAATDIDSFHAALVRENLAFLEDNSPSARVQAFDWLAVRALAPADYDPLGTPSERRLALEKASEPAAEEPR